MADTYTGEAGEGKVPLPGGPFRPQPAKDNPGDWCPLIDLMEIYPGNRGMNRHGVYDLYDAPVGVRFRIGEAFKSEPLLVSESEWEGGRRVASRLCVARWWAVPHAVQRVSTEIQQRCLLRVQR